METRCFGRTGTALPVLGLGCQRLVDVSGVAENDAVALLNAAADAGVRYFDTAPVYGLGQAERRLGILARERRADLWIASKTLARRRDAALTDLEGSLARLATPWLDEWRLHAVNTREELDLCCAPGGAVEAMVEAREQGLVRHASISGHADPGVLLEALRRFPFASVLAPVSALDAAKHSFVDRLLPEATARSAAVVGMKVHAHGALRAHAADALRYALGLPVQVVLVGCSSLDQLRFDLEVEATGGAMPEVERLAFERSLRPLATPRTLPWKAVEWGRTGEWLPLAGSDD